MFQLFVLLIASFQFFYARFLGNLSFFHLMFFLSVDAIKRLLSELDVFEIF